MILCICNNISEKDLLQEPFLINKIGSRCGKCIESPNSTFRVSCGQIDFLLTPQDRLPEQQKA